MPYSENLAERVRRMLKQRSGIDEKKMFGGVGFLMNGNMLVGIWHDSLIARVGVVQAADALKQPFVKEFDITGKPMTGWIVIEPEGIDFDEQLKGWITAAENFVATLPRK